MIKKLFSRKGKERNNFTCFGKEDDEESINGSDDFNEKQYKVKETISHRHTFRYTFSQSLAQVWCQHFYCIFCRLCKGKRKADKDTRIYSRAIKKLYQEIDILELVKLLRISKFMSSLYLTQNQRQLVKFSQRYCLHSNKFSQKFIEQKTTALEDRKNSEMTSLSLGDDKNVLNPMDMIADFKPETDVRDRKLYKLIVDERDFRPF